MKYLLARAVNKKSPGMNDKFDCIKKSSFLQIGGFNTKFYGHNIGVGAEDADLHISLKKIGKVSLSEASVTHLHYLNNDYTFTDLAENRKLLARSYGRIARMRWRETGPAILVFSIKPILSILLLISLVYPLIFLIVLIFSIWYMKRMYLTIQNLREPLMIFLPLITIYFIVYESFWSIESFLILDE